MNQKLELDVTKKKYDVPYIAVFAFDPVQDIVRTSGDANDTNVDASGMGGGFIDGIDG